VDETLYDDGVLLLDRTGVTLRHYYFPWAGSKHIGWSAIRRVQARPMGWLTGKGRLWGTANPGYWLPLDTRRGRKTTLLVFDIGTRVKPCVSPNQPERVLELLREQVPVD